MISRKNSNISPFRNQNTFYNWTSYIVIHDDSIDLEMEEQLYNLLTVKATMSMFRIDSE